MFRQAFPKGAVILLLASLSGASATWTPTGHDDPKVVAWFEAQQIMPAARARLMREYNIGWSLCCYYAERVKVRFVVVQDNYWAIPEDGSTPFVLPADTIHPASEPMPNEQLAAEGIVMVVKKGQHGAPVDIVTCVWLPQTSG